MNSVIRGNVVVENDLEIETFCGFNNGVQASKDLIFGIVSYYAYQEVDHGQD